MIGPGERGKDYGTVLVDLERRRVADLLPKRSAEQVAQLAKTARHS